MATNKVVGIDLGTTNSCVAILEGGDPVVIPNNEGGRTTPSIVGFTEIGERLVGSIAKRQAITNPQNTVFAVKRLIGRRFKTNEVESFARNAPYRIVESPNGDARVEISGRVFSPAEISAMILSKLKENAEEYLGEPIKQAVVTVPAYFNDSQRQSTREAGEIAGMEVLRIINEPTAASLAYGLGKDQGERIAVFDLGGGTFDVTILEFGDGVFQVLSTNGNTFLGGEDFDWRIVNYLLQDFRDHESIDLQKDRMALQRLKEAAEKAKHELSILPETEINLPFIAAEGKTAKHLKVKLARSKLDELCKDLVDQLEEPCRLAVQDSGLKLKDIEQIIMVGGMTRMPAVLRKVKEIFGKEPNTNMNPDEVVAVGAATQGAVLKGEIKEVLLLDITPLSLGIETFGGVFTRLIPRNTSIPTRRSEVFTTAEDNQDFVNVHALQGEREMATDNISLGRFQLVGIQPAPRGVPQIEVTFEIDADGIVHVSAKDLDTGKEQSIRITAKSGLSREEVDRLIREADNYKQEDSKRKQVADLKSQATGLLYSIERSLNELGDNLGSSEKAEIEITLSRARTEIDKNDFAALQGLIQRLSQVSSRIMTAISGGARGQAPRPAPAAAPPSRPADSSPVKPVDSPKEKKADQGGDFEEIKMDFDD